MSVPSHQGHRVSGTFAREMHLIPHFCLQGQCTLDSLHSLYLLSCATWEIYTDVDVDMDIYRCGCRHAHTPHPHTFSMYQTL